MAGGLKLTRRIALTAAGAAIAAPALGQTALARPPPALQTFMLVHGAWHGGWCWRDVARLLRNEGHRVLTPTLTGLGERLHLARADTGLAVHVEDVAAAIEAEELEDLILVAHSYAGLPCSYAAGRLPKRIRRLVYLDALLPTPGKAFFDGTPPEQREATMKALVDGFRLPPFPPAMLDVPKDHPNFAWVARRLTSMPIAPFTDVHPPLPPTLAGVAQTYVRCTGNSMGGPKKAAQRAAASGIEVIDLASGHDAMVTAAPKTAALLEQLAS